MTLPATDRKGTQGLSASRKSLRLPPLVASPVVTSIARLTLATVFLISGAFKALDTHSFLDSIRFYHLPSILYPGAYLLPAVGGRFEATGFAASAPEIAGRQLVFVFNPGCPHCWNYIANVTSLTTETNLDVFAVTYANAEEIANFEAFFATNFPIYSMDRETFLRRFRIWPSLYYLEDGIIEGKIEKEVPAPHTLRKVHFPE